MPTQSRTHPARRPATETETETDEIEEAQGPSRLPLALSLVALALAGLALAWGTVFAGGAGAGDCQARAWDAIPSETELPVGWRVETTNFFSNNLSVTIGGPPAAEGAEGAIYATVTCYGRDGGEALARSRSADISSGNATNDLGDIGDEGYSVGDDLQGLSTIHFRRGDLVAYIVIAGTVPSADLRATALAFDEAIRTARAGDVPSPAPPRSAVPGSPAPETAAPEPSAAPSAAPSGAASPDASAAAPGLEGLLPTEVEGTTLTTDSVTGTEVLQDDPSSRAIVAALRTLGKTPADLQVAQAYDEADELDLYFVAFRLPGADPEPFRQLILQSWLVAEGEGVTVNEVELAGKQLTHVDYGDELPDAYLYSTGDTVIILNTFSEELAEAGAAELP